MRTTSRLAVSAAILGGGLLLAAPASAQEACPYPFDPADSRCQVQGGAGGGATGGEGTVGGGTVGEGTVGEGTVGGGTVGGGTADSGTLGGGAQGAGTSDVDNSPVRNTAGGGGAASLPFTGGEVTLIALAGVAAVGGGVALTRAGRTRATS